MIVELLRNDLDVKCNQSIRRSKEEAREKPIYEYSPKAIEVIIIAFGKFEPQLGVVAAYLSVLILFCIWLQQNYGLGSYLWCLFFLYLFFARCICKSTAVVTSIYSYSMLIIKIEIRFLWIVQYYSYLRVYINIVLIFLDIVSKPKSLESPTQNERHFNQEVSVKCTKGFFFVLSFVRCICCANVSEPEF